MGVAAISFFCCVRLLWYLIPSCTYMSRLYMYFYICFTSLHSHRQYLSLSTSIDNRLNLLCIHILFIHTTALFIDIQFLHMSALWYVISYLYYSAPISLYLSLSLKFLCLLILSPMPN